MKQSTIKPKQLQGKINIPPSKSLSHRAIICAGLSEGESIIENIIFSKDVEATINAIKSLNVIIDELSDKELHSNIKRLRVVGKSKLHLIKNHIDCFESGSTLRFLIPITLLTGELVTFHGRGKLVSRPLDVYYEILDSQQIQYSNNKGNLPLNVKGAIKPDIFKVKGNISSQFITGLMFILPLLNEDSKIIVTTDLESKGYVDLTIDCLKKFGVHICNNDYKEFIIKGNQKYISRNYKVEGDFSQGAFWIVAGILGLNIKLFGLNVESLQGDKVIVDIVKKMGANIKIKEKFIEVKKSHTKGIAIDASECPDLVPIIAVLGSVSLGTTKIVNAKRLRIKECDRLKAVATELDKIGADIQETEDGLIINGKENLRGGIVDSWNDHRIAMAMAIASIKCTDSLTIKNSSVVSKSYPYFWDDFKMLGGIVDEWSMGE